ncbi:hypothetical protein V6N13_111435 [Hibiscus sabdariffa]|uniref:Uncharacterized protein n=1 Tax=Hibiscus sabdariffa TaxID=183260 RepID=A0ABR2TKH8_9ROSI
MSRKVTKESKLGRYLKAPIRILIMARDLYIESMAEYSERVSFGTLMGCPTGQVNGLSRSYSVGSKKSINRDDDLRELIRAASTRSSRNKVQLEHQGRRSVGIGRIDEDKPCEFEDEVYTGVFPRSTTTYGVIKKKTVFL